MSLSKNAVTIITLLVILICSTSSINATNLLSQNLSTPIVTELQKVEGGPRDVVQTMTEVIIFQPTANNLYINIVNNDGEVVKEQQSKNIKTVMTTTDLEEGTYIVETVDDKGDYQEFVIEVM